MLLVTVSAINLCHNKIISKNTGFVAQGVFLEKQST